MANEAQQDALLRVLRFGPGEPNASKAPLADDQQPMSPERAAKYAQLHALVRKDVPSPFAPVIDPFAITELTRRYMETLTAIVEPIVAHLDDRYPHTCPRCQGPAYVGAVEVDCAGGCK